MERVGTKPDDYTYAVFHQPNGKFPLKVAKMLGFSKEQVQQGLLCPMIGNTYSGASMVGLASVLDVAKPGDRVFLSSYGSGAGSDSFDITVTNRISELARNKAPLISQFLESKEYIDYSTYAKYRDLLYWE
jgi:hydroxymethylglutaryl-CoA synthase